MSRPAVLMENVTKSWTPAELERLAYQQGDVRVAQALAAEEELPELKKQLHEFEVDMTVAQAELVAAEEEIKQAERAVTAMQFELAEQQTLVKKAVRLLETAINYTDSITLAEEIAAFLDEVHA